MKVCLDAAMAQDPALLAFPDAGRFRWRADYGNSPYGLARHQFRGRSHQRPKGDEGNTLASAQRRDGPGFPAAPRAMGAQIRSHFSGGCQSAVCVVESSGQGARLEVCPSNCLRHSPASYHVPVHNDYQKLSILMGHANAKMTKYK
jgi:hypothetical protein